MARLTLAQAAAWCGGTVAQEYAQTSFDGVCNDTRKLQPGQLFVALKAARDGHDFIPAALEKGAAAVLCTHCDGDHPAIVVEDTRLALGQIARGYRESLSMKVIGVTGSVGKSTTKEMIAAVLSTTYRTGKTPVNFNNDIGMPMGVLALSADTQAAVLEMGMNHFGEISYLTSIAKPNVAVIVNIGTMHIEHLGSREGILQAKLEILEGLQPGGSVLLNGDDALLWSKNGDIENCRYFGQNNESCGVRAVSVTQEPGVIRMTIRAGEQEFPISLPLEGMHFVPDALAAVAVGLELGVTPENIALGLENFRNMQGRQQIYSKKGFTIIEDCYNAGPESMAAALEVLSSKPGRRIAVLGDMLELGTRTQAEHYRIGRIAAEKVDYVYAYGPDSPRVIKGAITGGLVGKKARSFTDRDELVRELKKLALPGDTLLFKGSRGMRMELALEKFLEDDK